MHIIILSSIFPCSFAALGIGRNQTEIDPETTISTCGVHFCPADGSTEKDDTEKFNNGSNTIVDENFKTTDTQIYVLAGVYLACSLLAPILIAIFVEPLSRFVYNGAKIRIILLYFHKIFSKLSILERKEMLRGKFKMT